MKNAYILSATRTGIGGFLGSLSPLSAIELGGKAIQSAIEKANISREDIDEVILGNVLSANLGQSPARQAAIYANIPHKADATTVNKVCSSGMKAIAYGAQSIFTGNSDVVIAGGMESMSNAPYYVNNHRMGTKTGHETFVDGMLKDGLWDPYFDFHMGNAAEMANLKYNISREEQDEYTLQSFEKAAEAHQKGILDNERFAVTVPLRKGALEYNTDEDVDKLKKEKVPHLSPIFEKEGSITAANASNLNDGAAALVLASEEYVQQHQLKPLAKIVAFADAAQSPEWFTTSPALSMAKALKMANMTTSEIDYFEINEAYANVPIINSRLLNIDLNKVNVHGGAVAIGHPLGASGARIVATLLNVLQTKGGRYGLAGICNGGGGSSALLIEKL